MTIAILGIISALIPVALWFFWRWAKSRDAPEKRDDKINKAIAQGDSTTVNVALDDVLKRLRNADDSNSGG